MNIEVKRPARNLIKKSRVEQKQLDSVSLNNKKKKPSIHIMIKVMNIDMCHKGSYFMRSCYM